MTIIMSGYACWNGTRFWSTNDMPVLPHAPMSSNRLYHVELMTRCWFGGKKFSLQREIDMYGATTTKPKAIVPR